MKEQVEAPLYNYFVEQSTDRCLFTGKPVSPEENITVFPDWIMTRYHLHDQWLGLLNMNRALYKDVKVPCSPEAKRTIEEMEEQIQQAFESGYEKVTQLDPDLIFLWSARIVCGLLYYELEYGKEFGRKKGREFIISPLLTRKYSDLMLMTQSLFYRVRWEGTPHSFVLKKISYSKDGFNFRDESRKLNLSLGMIDFGFALCLQDRGRVKEFTREVLDKTGDAVLHPIQFEEVCARFIYTNYILEEHSGWDRVYENGEVVMKPILDGKGERLGEWDDKIYSSTLGEYWKPWGIESKDIYNFPDSPVSFLVNEYTNEFIDKSEIDLPY
ncbi:MAG: hypothetical protein J5I50_04840 [Chitinophagaceae bacterium]|nr:hypothetical protein [Chitinophagaceae bacterium]